MFQTSILKRQSISLVFALIAVIALIGFVLMLPSPALADGATQISGVGYFDENGDCSYDDVTVPDGTLDTFALVMEGDLEGCHYIFIMSYECSPSGTYRERGTELFVGEYNGQEGTFGTTYLFTAKLGACPNLATEIWGRCQHPIVAGSGTDDFAGVTGRFDIKDDLEAGNFPYKGHLRW